MTEYRPPTIQEAVEYMKKLKTEEMRRIQFYDYLDRYGEFFARRVWKEFKQFKQFKQKGK